MGEFLLLLGSYLMGSIPTGHLIVKKMKGVDIRNIGSRSTGATNVNRILGRDWGRAVMIIDILKGFLVAILSLLSGFNLWIIGMAILLVVVGHTFPIFIRFKGGKGVATFLGILISLLIFCFVEFPHPWTYGALLGIIVLWLIVHKSRRMMGLSSLFLMPLIILYFAGLTILVEFSLTITIFMTLTSLLVVYNHRENWRRLWRGKESKTDLI
jgi:glycerol-3-phosphate acyltransferase PlsY